MNGFLGSFHTNNKSVESQVFRKFVVTQQSYSTVLPKSELTGIVKPILNEEISKDTIYFARRSICSYNTSF